MGKYFTFIGRELELCFFETDPIRITMTISDQMNEKIDGALNRIKDSKGTHREILEDLIGKDATSALLSRIDGEADYYVLDQLILYVHNAYVEGMAKNFQAAGSGRQRT